MWGVSDEWQWTLYLALAIESHRVVTEVCQSEPLPWWASRVLYDDVSALYWTDDEHGGGE